MGRHRVILRYRVLMACGVALVGVGLYGGFGPMRTEEFERLDQGLGAVATEQAVILETRLDRARTDAQLLGRQGALVDLIALDNGDGLRPPEDAPEVVEATELLEYLGDVYPASIGEICLIRRDGVEATRVVFGEPVGYEDLSDDEAGSVFFGPTLAMQPGQVYLAPPYVSPDTEDWVISASTTLPGSQALVHFELGLNALRESLADSPYVTMVVNRRSGTVVFDSRTALNADAQIGSTVLDGWAQRDQDGSLTVAGRQAMSRDVFDFGFNANDWTVVVAADQGIGLLAGFGAGPVAAVVLGILLTITAWRAMIDHRRRTNEALTDELTGLGNRRRLREELSEALKDRGRSSVAVAVVDLDHFKEVNDTLGHHWGDELLRVVAARLQHSLRAGDSVFRLGGDEFALLIRSVPDRLHAAAVSQRAVTDLCRPVVVGDVSVMVNASLGLGIAPEHGTDPEDLLRRAEVAMYEAKRTRQPVVAYDTSIDPYRPERLALVQELREAIAAGELELWFQPIIEPGTGRWSSVEALLRWPGRPLPISEVIDVAEANGLMKPLTDLVLSRALTQVAAWGEAGFHMGVSVNVSVANLFEPDLVERISVALAVAGVSPALLSIEVTETAVMSDRGQARQVLEQIGQLGVAVGIDDYGSGNAGLSYLRELPVKFLKIDRMFVQHLLTNPTDAAIVRSTVDLGHSLGLYVVAEGVETAEVRDVLAEIGCDLLQGYLFGRAVPAEQLTELLKAQAVIRRPAGR